MTLDFRGAYTKFEECRFIKIVEIKLLVNNKLNFEGKIYVDGSEVLVAKKAMESGRGLHRGAPEFSWVQMERSVVRPGGPSGKDKRACLSEILEK